MRRPFFSVLLSVLALGGCTTGGEPSVRDGGTDAARDAGQDASMPSCVDDRACDDGFECTVDSCGVGRVCRHMALDALCATGERCVEGSGCRSGMPSECMVDADCADGQFCNGDERCLGPAGSRTCVIGTPVDCDDGDACSVDACDDALAGCRYTLAPGCDAGVPLADGGVPCDAFTPASVAGTFTFRPAAVSACIGSATYNIGEITVTEAAGTLRVTADRFTLTQSPAPSDGTFDVRYADGCGQYRLTGSYTCADRWMGTWTASFSGECAGICADQTAAVRGSRR